MALLRLAFLALVLTLAGCDRSSDRGAAAIVASAVQPASAAAPRRKVALVVKTLNNPFFVEIEKGARRAESELGFRLIVRSASQETSIEQQIQIVDELTRDKVDAIVIAPGDSQRLIPSLKHAQDAHIVVVNIDNRLDPAAMQRAGMRPVPFVSVDNERSSWQAAKVVVDRIDRPTQALLIEGIRSADNAQQRAAGFERAIAGNPKLHLVAKESGHWQLDEGYEVTRKAFAAHPAIGAIFAANDMMALGALRYLADAGRHDVRVVAYDAIADARAAIRAGTLAASVDQRPADQAYQGAMLAMQALAGQAVPAQVLVETSVVTAQTLAPDAR